MQLGALGPALRDESVDLGDRVLILRHDLAGPPLKHPRPEGPTASIVGGTQQRHIHPSTLNAASDSLTWRDPRNFRITIASIALATLTSASQAATTPAGEGSPYLDLVEIFKRPDFRALNPQVWPGLVAVEWIAHADHTARSQWEGEARTDLDQAGYRPICPPPSRRANAAPAQRSW